MKSRTIKLLTLSSSIVAMLSLSGCGGGTTSSIEKQPHDTSKLGRTVSIEKDWTWDVSFSTHVAAINDASDDTYVEAHFWAGIPDNIENFQIFIDMDNNKSTGYSGSNGWEIYGADYLIENGDVYVSTSTTEWKWKIRGTFQDVDFRRVSGEGKYESLYMTNATPTLSRIFTSDSFKVMIEAYDKNWEGNFNTITGIVADVSGFGTGTGGVDLSAIEKKIRAKYNAEFTTVTTIDFAPNKQEAIVMMINKWTGKKMYLVDVTNIEVATPIAEEYAKKFIYKTNVVKDNGIVEFQVKEDDGQKFQVVYDYKNNKEISKTLITENTKKVLVKKSKDVNNDGVIDYVISYTYHDNGKLKTRNNGVSTRHYNEHGDLIKYSSDSTTEYRYSYNSDGKIEKVETVKNGVVQSFLRYEYNAHGDRIYTYENNEDNPQWYYIYEYDANGNVLKKEEYENHKPYEDELTFTEIFKYDEQNRVIEYFVDTYDSNPTHYIKSYNNEGKEVKRIDLSSDDDGVAHDRYYEYNDEGYLVVEKIDSHDSHNLKKGDTDEVIYYEWK
jgi:YD repeat-containing protein